jgi:hypothetical protein
MNLRPVAWAVGGLAVALLALWLVADRGASTVAAPSSPSPPASPASRPAAAAPALPASAPPALAPDVPDGAGPGGPDGDPAAVSRALVELPGELFAAEPRDEAFAAARERELRTKLERLRTVAPGFPLTRLECRTRTCALTLAASSRLPEAEVNAALDVIHALRIADGVAVVSPHGNDPDAPTLLEVYLEFAAEAPAPVAPAQLRGAAPADWAGFVRAHPGESSELVNAILWQWRYPGGAAFAMCGAPARIPQSPRYAFEGQAELASKRATITGWSCSSAPSAEEGMCDCIASGLPGELTVQLAHGDATVVYRGKVTVLL